MTTTRALSKAGRSGGSLPARPKGPPDPRVDPREKDVVRKGTEEREVSDRFFKEGPAGSVEMVCYVGTHCCEPEVQLRSWRRWAKDAEVVFCAPR
jgi:hypothetical protein